jgi:hypothetical protein
MGKKRKKRKKRKNKTNLHKTGKKIILFSPVSSRNVDCVYSGNEKSI